MAAGIVGTGSYLPEQVLDNGELARRFGVMPEWILERTGIRERRVAAPGQFCSDLAISAGREALADASATAEEIGLLIVATSSGDYRSPATAALVQDGLGIRDALCFDLSAACSGFVYGLIVAWGQVASGVCRKALVIGAEVLSRVVDPTDINTAVLFGDGAGAVVIGPVAEGYGMLAADSGSDGSSHAMVTIPWHGGRPTAASGGASDGLLQMDGALLFMFAMRVFGDSALRAIKKAGLSPEDIDLFIPHQANRRIIEAATGRLRLPLEKTVLNLECYGNTSAASIPIALHETVRAGRIREGDRVVMTGFGAGLSWGSVLLRWGSL